MIIQKKMHNQMKTTRNTISDYMTIDYPYIPTPQLRSSYQEDTKHRITNKMNENWKNRMIKSKNNKQKYRENNKYNQNDIIQNIDKNINHINEINCNSKLNTYNTWIKNKKNNAFNTSNQSNHSNKSNPVNANHLYSNIHNMSGVLKDITQKYSIHQNNQKDVYFKWNLKKTHYQRQPFTKRQTTPNRFIKPQLPPNRQKRQTVPTQSLPIKTGRSQKQTIINKQTITYLKSHSLPQSPTPNRCLYFGIHRSHSNSLLKEKITNIVQRNHSKSLMKDKMTPTYNKPSNIRTIHQNPYHIQKKGQNCTPISQSKKHRDKIITMHNKLYKTKSRSNYEMSKCKTIHNEKYQLKINDFILGQCIGSGRFGRVYLGIDKYTNTIYAIKKVPKDSVSHIIQQFIQEIKLQLYLNHQNIVKIYGYFDDKYNIYIIMQYMQQGSLYDVIKNEQALPQQQVLCILKSMCSAIQYCHSLGITYYIQVKLQLNRYTTSRYQTLKYCHQPRNYRCTQKVCKLCDFGWGIHTDTRRQTYCGTLDYICPQILQGLPYNQSVDIWSLGVLAYEISTGNAPFYHVSRQQTMHKIINCELSFPQNMCYQIRRFILKTVKRDPKQRWSVNELLNDSLFK